MQPQPAFLLHKRPYRETSALVELLTLDHGRVRAVAQGVQRPGSRSRSQMQPFAPLHLTWQGDRELKRLRLIESRGPAAMLAGEGLLCGLYANELLTRLLPVELPVGQVFAFYTSALDELATPASRAAALRRLEFALLDALDAAPRFTTPDGGGLDPQRRYRFEPGSRAFVVAERGIDGRTLRLLAGADWGEAGLAGPAKALSRAALAPLLGDRPLRSRALMVAMAERRRQAR
ncbi:MULTISPECIES: DNA repair protein RecO [Halomonas]|uniref:DNA repair protein RecO n=4 Tax=Halomonas TaxID=2745 RepID=A0AAU7KM21_9GAMM|nr:MULTISPECIES: DNA repair protein RecO [Halomonas]MBR9769696.1 DNA repair protein RecO [Gammaproteobacteria bacterium]MBS8268865.1 DNA repair protein RecO [Halomonas litopenaei]MBY6112254.1 DNA repair protein RecO [Halomonas sp. DP1Y21-3]MCJ8286795.1 DNA repair protein RecO [Halomonas sp.]NQY71508.1 DNA repair protein RecO [Halomonas sp.]